MESYCGKRCLDCEFRQSMECMGCTSGPGREEGGSCPLAQCRKGKKLSGCNACSDRFNCMNYALREDIPQANCDGARYRAANMKHLMLRAPLLGKWLPILFWLFVPNLIAGILKSDFVAPSLVPVGMLLGMVCTLCYGVILLRLGSVEKQYHTSGVLCIISLCCSLLVLLLQEMDVLSGWTMLLSLPADLMVIIFTILEMNAHSAVLKNVDDDLARNWLTLRTGYIVLLCITFVSPFLVFVNATLAMIVLLISGIASICISIMKLVYLYRTSQVFARYHINTLHE